MSYFDELFGTPELTRREGWDGKEERLASSDIDKASKAIWEAWNRDTSDPNNAAYGMPLAPDTIDIDHEEVS